MILTVDINNMARPVLNRTSISAFKNFRTFKLKRRLANTTFNAECETLITNIDSFILALEGSYNHLRVMDEEKVDKVLTQVKEIISKIEIQNSDLKKINYLDKLELKERYAYMLNCLYKIESILHKRKYLNSETIKTDTVLKEGVVQLTSSYFKTSNGF